MKYPQVMTIVKSSPEEKPLIISSNIPGSVLFRENEVAFLKETLTYFEDESKELRKKAEEYRDSLSL